MTVEYILSTTTPRPFLDHFRDKNLRLRAGLIPGYGRFAHFIKS